MGKTYLCPRVEGAGSPRRSCCDVLSSSLIKSMSAGWNLADMGKWPAQRVFTHYEIRGGSVLGRSSLRTHRNGSPYETSRTCRSGFA